MSITINNIYKTFEDKTALNGISFNAKKGDIVGILGPNGAGKSTMMKIIAGYFQQNKGTVNIFGYDTLKDDILTKRKIGYLSEENPLYQDM